MLPSGVTVGVVKLYGVGECRKCTPMKTTRPSAEAITGSPTSPGKSRPAWRRFIDMGHSRLAYPTLRAPPQPDETRRLPSREFLPLGMSGAPNSRVNVVGTAM